MISIPLFLGWLSFLIYGICLLRASKYRKTGITLITLFFVPIVLSAFLMWFMNFSKIDCYLHTDDQSKCRVENNWEY